MTDVHFVVSGSTSTQYGAFEQAELFAKKRTADRGDDTFIYQSVAKATAPVPAIDVVKFA